MPDEIKISLKQFLLHELKIRKLMHVSEIYELTTDHGYKLSNAERRLRRERKGEWLPVIKLNRFKKPIKPSERIEWYKWAGMSTVFNKKSHAKNSTKTEKNIGQRPLLQTLSDLQTTKRRNRPRLHLQRKTDHRTLELRPIVQIPPPTKNHAQRQLRQKSKVPSRV